MNTLLMIGTTEIILIATVGLLVFGGKKIPEVMRGLGQGVKNFKEGMREVTDPNPQPQPKKEAEETTENSEKIENEQ